MRNRVLLLAGLLALAMPAMALDAKPKCNGELFKINDQYVCVVAVAPEDYYRPADTKRKPAPGSLVITPVEKPQPHFKLAGHLMTTEMIESSFDASSYIYEMGRPYAAASSNASLTRTQLGWGLSAQWSPDDRFWMEAGWQRTPTMNATLNTSVTYYLTRIPCHEGQPCETRFADDQTNRHRLFADDIALALKWDLTPENKFISVLPGVGVHQRYATNRVSIDTTFYRPEMQTFQAVKKVDGTVRDTNRAVQTRLLGQLDLELYPAGKDRFIGFAMSGRVLSDGEREHEFSTDTLLDENVRIGIKPGWYDVTARVILRF